MEKVVGIVLAAGLSRRMGRPKQLLPWGRGTLLQHVVTCARQGIDRVIVVVGHRRDEIEASLMEHSVECVYNPAFADGMLSSVRSGIAAAGPVEAYMLFLGDQPHIGKGAVTAVVEGWRHSGKGLVIPTYCGKRGHPVLIAARYRAAIESLPAGQGLNVVTRGHPQDTLEVEVGEEGVLQDLDTPDDYRHAIERRTREGARKDLPSEDEERPYG